MRSAAVAAGATLLAGARSGSAAESSGKAARGEVSGIELAVATICTDGFGNHHHEPAFRMIPHTGITAVEFNIWYPELLSPAYADSIVRRCSETGLRPVCVQGTSFGGEGANAVMNDVGHKLWLMEYARRLGCRRVKCTGAGRGTNGGLEHVIEVCRELAPMAEELDVLLLLENHDRNVLEREEDYAEIFSTIDSPHIGMCLDTGHFTGSGISSEKILETFRDRVLHVDLKDQVAFGQGHNTAVFGEGVVDFDPLLTNLVEGGYSGYLVIEMAWREPRAPVVENLIDARQRFVSFTRE